MPDNTGANTYGGKDSWDDYDNSNTITPSVPSAPINRMKGRIMSRSHSKEEREATAKAIRDIAAEQTTDEIVSKGGT